MERWRQKKAGRRRQRRWWVVEVVSVFSDKVPMDLRRRRRIKVKKGKIYKRKGEKRFVTNLATKG